MNTSKSVARLGVKAKSQADAAYAPIIPTDFGLTALMDKQFISAVLEKGDVDPRIIALVQRSMPERIFCSFKDLRQTQTPEDAEIAALTAAISAEEDEITKLEQELCDDEIPF